MRITIAVLAALLSATAFGQRGAYYGPFTDAEAQLLSAVWPEIRTAENFEDIDWPELGLNRAPGNADVRRAMASNWDELRRAQRFEQVDWDRVVRSDQRADRGDQLDRFEQRFPGPFSDVGPFTRDEAAVLSRLWPQIREAAEFDDIDWSAFNLERAPGGADARQILAAKWNELRREESFADIDWDEIVDDEELVSSRRYAGGFAGGSAANPFTEHEAALMSQAWDEIRVAADYDDIDWRAAGLSGAPGDRRARRIMATHWDDLRTAARFGDIDWAATTGQARRVLR